MADGTYLSFRIYVLSTTQIELRLKIESKANQDGKRLIIYGSAIYNMTDMPRMPDIHGIPRMPRMPGR